MRKPTCHEKINFLEKNEYNMRDPLQIDTRTFLLSITPQLLTIVCYLVLLGFYLIIEDLKKTAHGKCWINFIINSLINYLASIVFLILVHSGFDPSDEMLFMFFASLFMIVFITEFSLYFWLNITFFEAFYIIR
jgi:hypothetical protein